MEQQQQPQPEEIQPDIRFKKMGEKQNKKNIQKNNSNCPKKRKRSKKRREIKLLSNNTQKK
uniref:Uncharacterized protein n=1 Tax=Anopheles quadriannulatus TaxID=34691 RepID=A0A182XR09_ANOQN